MPSPVNTGNSSSPSLEGMERPVRSFKSFVKTVPPAPNNVANHKPLPPTPTAQSPSASLTSQPSPVSPASASTPSAVPWRAPAEWSTTPHSAESLPAPPANRQYSPLLPDPSPDPTDRLLELCAARGESPQLQQARLLPIYERSDSNFGPPREPPQSPLPPPPRSPARVSPKGKRPARSPSNGPTTRSRTQWSGSSGSGVARTDSPAHSNRSHTSNMSLREKAFATLGLDRPREQQPPAQATSQFYKTEKIVIPDPDYNRSPTSYGSSRQPRSPGWANSDAHSEDVDLSEYARRLAVSRDYHDALVDEYHDSKRAQERYPPSDRHLYPAPLSWNKDSNGNSPRSTSETRQEFGSSGTQSKRTSNSNMKRLSNKMTGWVPKRLSVGPKRSEASDEPGLRNKDDIEDHLRFSKFFPKGTLPRLRRKSDKGKANGPMHTRSASALDVNAATNSRTPTPILRLPLGLSVVRTPPAPPPPPPDSQITAPPDAHSHRSTVSSDNTPTGTMSTATTPHSPTSAELPSHRSSYNNNNNNSDHYTAAAVANRAIQPHRHSGGAWSSHSQQRGSSSSFSEQRQPPPPRPLSPPSNQSPGRRPPPIPDPPPPTSAFSTDSKTTASLTSTTGVRARSPPSRSQTEREKPRSQLHFPALSLVERMREGRRNRDEEARHERLKRSIRVLGPTDPTVVAVANVGGLRGRKGSTQGEVGRLPGFVVGGVV